MPEPPQRAPIASAALSLVLPLYGAASDPVSVARGWDEYLKGTEREYEILAVGTGAGADVIAAVEDLAGQLPHVRLVRGDKGDGFGAALRAGLAAAHHPLLFYTACDDRYTPADLPKLLERIDAADLVSGTRVNHAKPFVPRWVGRLYRLSLRVLFGLTPQVPVGWLGWKSRIYHWLLRAWTGVRLRDVNCAYKLFRRQIFVHIPVQSDGPFVHAEIMAKANFLGCPMDEAAISGPPDHDACRLWSLLREGSRVLGHADFGPVRGGARRNTNPKRERGKETP
jgi:glycosyltransferase involved in cell wall biosynthesis